MTQASPRSANILVTGAGSGLGRGISQFLAARGHQIFATDLNLAAAQETVALITAAAGRAQPLELDVTSEPDVARLLRDLGSSPVDVLVNNAGIQHVAPLDEFPQDKWDKLIDVMLKGPCLLTRAVLPGMRERGFGRIVNLGSIHSLIASPFKSAYNAAKHGLLGFSKTIALETADTDITVNTICPSYVRTPLVEAQIAAQAKVHGIPVEQVVTEIMLRPMPKKRFITIDEIAAAIEFLMSDYARNITGQTIVIDGGWTIQ